MTLLSSFVLSLAFIKGVIEINEPIEKREFEEMISKKISEIGSCIDNLLLDTGLRTCDVDSVFLTGGTSHVPCVRRVLGDKFGVQKLKMGDVFTSVVAGLALSSKLL